MRLILLIGVAGGFGAISRYGLSVLAARILGTGFAYGTLLVNVVGCLLIGILMYLGLNTDIMPQETRIAVTTGFLGALTTFSTFSYETTRYIQDGAWSLAIGNIAANVILAILATIIGLALGRLLFGGS